MAEQNESDVRSGIFNQDMEVLADWDDANKVCDRHGAPKGMSLAGRVTWLLTKRSDG